MKAIGFSMLSVFMFCAGWIAYYYYPLGTFAVERGYGAFVFRPTFWVLASTVYLVTFFGCKGLFTWK